MEDSAKTKKKRSRGGKNKGKVGSDQPQGSGGRTDHGASVLPSRPEEERQPRSKLQNPQPTSSVSLSEGGARSQSSASSPPPASQEKTLPLESLASMTLASSTGMLPPEKRVQRLFPGTLGRPCRLATNHFPITLPKGLVYMYNVEVVPPWQRVYRRSDRPLYQQVLLAWRQVCPAVKSCPQAWVYDGVKTLYSTREVKGIPNTTVTITPMGEQRPLEFRVTDVNLVKKVPVSQEMADWASRGRSGCVPQDSIHALDVVLSQAVATDLQFEVIGRSFFHVQGQVLDVGFGKEVWTGLFASVRPMGWKKTGVLATLNVDVSNKPATKELHLTLARGGQESYLEQVLGGGGRGRRQPLDFKKGLTREQVELLEQDIKGLKVRYELPNGSKRGYKVNGLKESANKLMIPDLKMTVEQYFMKTYKKKLDFPRLPCLWLGSLQKTIYIPLELCSMTAQALPRGKQLHDEAVAKMIRSTAVSPLERQKKIMAELQANNKAYANNAFTREFGINIAGEMANLNGRVLAPPGIEYDQKKIVRINEEQPGKWVQRSGENRYVDGKELAKWAILDLAMMSSQEVGSLVDNLARVGSGLGLKVMTSKDVLTYSQTYDNKLEKDFNQLVAGHQGLQMVVVVLPFKNAMVYDKVKELGDIRHRLPTQCCLKRNIFRPDGSVNMQVMSNICLKLNSKLGGINHVLATECRPGVLKSPVMIMGADVTHPAPQHRGLKPSIAAIVGSVDPKASKFEVQIRVQDSSQNEEVIQDLKEVTKKLLHKFYQETNYKPQRLIMYRDGVSEGQFLTVLARELTAIRQACREMAPDGSYQPKITYLVVQKRHHTRFFPCDNNRYKNGNALAGTVVDQGINHPTEGDFYLLSHEGIQGTSRPCHYQVLWDDSDLTADTLETLSYYLCHLYARCTRSVSYPTPTYYSHLAAERARKHHNELTNQSKGLTKDRVKGIIEETRANLMYFV